MSCTSASFYIKQENLDYITEQVAQKSRYNKSNWLDDLCDHLRAKKKPKKKEVIAIAYPDNLNIEAWNLWVEFRKKAKFKSYKTDATMKKLASMGDYHYQLLVIKQSVDNQYQGLFEVNNEKHNKPNKQLSALEKVERACEEQNRSNGLMPEVVESHDRNVHGQVHSQERISADIDLDSGDFFTD